VQTDNKSRVEELRKQFAAALEGTESAHKQAREDMLAEKTEELAALEGALEQERRLHEKSQEDLQYAHQLQLKVLKRAVDDERESTARTQATFEETLRAKYDQLVGALQQRADQEERQRVQRALQQLEAIALSPKTDDAANARSAETAAAEKFQSLVAELRANWQQAEEQRVEQLENRLRVHYETVLEHAQIQVQMALKLNDDADQRWMEDLAHRNKRQIEAMHAFEDKCKRLYEGRLTEHEEQMQEQLAQYEDRILAHAKETAGLQEQTERGQVSGTRGELAAPNPLHSNQPNPTNPACCNSAHACIQRTFSCGRLRRASVVRPRRRAHHERPGGQAHLQCVPHRCLHAKPLHPVVSERVVLAGCPVV
jgi:hypothetical protein